MISSDLVPPYRDGAIKTIDATGGLAASDPLKLIGWTNAKWGVTQ